MDLFKSEVEQGGEAAGHAIRGMQENRRFETKSGLLDFTRSKIQGLQKGKT